MKKIYKFVFPFIIISQVLLFISCNRQLPPEERQGKWLASCEFGSFGFVIDPGGTKIVYFTDSLKCKSGSHSNKYTWDGGPGSDLIDGKISLILFAFANVPAVEVEGKFYQDMSGNAVASGNLWMFGRNNCATTWSAQKLK